ncbi:hypothetical protein HAP47_0005230 [Bradyrhizobium sp. 41S5]|uniref:hypothetical protein n=1 Tax=Bradyrhizobium sp. 41S5 TaxID=1404443 RepID=UPI00156BBE8A|nr:hypothetical protein [Bradyrhizobium sp. 41S5]UFX46118.1 hypothetical protein HAP47_0005230 [Bradyrhizobium sp. 41S5]
MQGTPTLTRPSMRRGISRRRALRNLVSSGLAFAVLPDLAIAQEVPDDFNEALLRFTPSVVEATREYHDQEFIPAELGLERQPIRARKSDTEISSKAIQLIINSEVSGEAAYKNAYRRPTWPEGRSGITIGIGYDVGYVDAFSLEQDWKDYTSAENIKLLSNCCGKVGEIAHKLMPDVQAVVIDYEPARDEFLTNEKKRYVGLTEDSLPNSKLLRPDSLGALVSLVYNRGASFSIPPERDPEGRYAEMRAIKAHMANKDWKKIPGELRSMQRIWRGTGLDGLLIRRELEARLFEQGMPTG